MAGLADLAKRLADLEGIPSRIAKEVAAGIEVLISKEFASETDPYGRAWARLLPQTVRRKGGDTRILRRTDAMASTVEVDPTSGSGVAITMSVPYASAHQTGTKHMVARKVLPDGSDLPSEWKNMIHDAATREFSKALKK